MASSNPLAKRRDDSWAVWLGAAAAAAVWLGGTAAVREGRLNWEAVEAAASAYRVVHGGPASLSQIGFGRPPVPALILVPVAWVWPAGLRSGYGGPVLGALAAFMIGMWLGRMVARAGLLPWVAWVLCGATVLHPVVYSALAGGAPAGLLFAFSLAGLAGLAEWAERGTLRDLIASSAYLALAVLTDHTGLAVLGAAAIAVFATAGRRQGGDEAAGRRAVREGATLLFLMGPLYALALWVMAGWAIVGRPWLSLRVWIDSVASGPGVGGTLWLATLACGGWLGVAVMAAAAAAAGRTGAAVAMAVAIASVAGIAAVGRGAQPVGEAWGSGLAPAMVVKAGTLVAGCLVLGWLVELWRRGVGAGRLVAVGACLVAVGAAVSVGGGLRGGWPARPSAMFAGRIGFVGSRSQLDEAVEVVRRAVARWPGREIFVSVPDGLGFAVGLIVGEPRLVRAPVSGRPRAGTLEVVYSPGARPAPRWPDLGPRRIEGRGEWAIFEYSPPGGAARESQGGDSRGRQR